MLTVIQKERTPTPRAQTPAPAPPAPVPAPRRAPCGPRPAPAPVPIAAPALTPPPRPSGRPARAIRLPARYRDELPPLPPPVLVPAPKECDAIPAPLKRERNAYMPQLNQIPVPVAPNSVESRE